ncbi:hypothetical protein [Roseateles sp. LYH14W]|uniref:Uncharacterized protein n=1 Tax=Pelomonas parva TaxID=3299032 RepID=A0ABW7EWU2_9BURK
MTSSTFVQRDFPARIANLGFSVDLPDSWQAQDLPEEEPAFDDATRLFGLAAVAAPYAAIILVASARPAFDEGTVQDWALWLIQQHQVQPSTLGPASLGDLPAIVGQCAVQGDFGPMTMFFAFAEDGGRLLHLSLIGPDALGAHVFQVWQRVLASFRLAAPQGATVLLQPQPEVMTAAPGDDLTLPDIGSFALAGGRATLEQTHPINQALLEQGQGFAPRIQAMDEDNGRAWVVSPALQAVLAVPLGWHLLDDSRRLLLLHPDSSVQISLEQLPAPEGDLQALLGRIEAQARADYPAPQCQRIASGATVGLAVFDIDDGPEPIAQLHLLVAGNEPETALRARVTTTREQATMAGDLGEVLLYGIQFQMEFEPPAPDDGQPEWAREAYALEAQDRLEEAEQAMRRGCDHIGVLISIAHMYRQRMLRLAQAGDTAGAAHARSKAVEWAYSYAGSATSGGEGAALSMERDEFVRELGGQT